MKKIFLGTVVLLLITSVGYGQEVSSTLQLTIRSDKQLYEVGEEINIEAKIRNIGKDTVKIYSPDYWGVSEIVVKNSKGLVIKPRGLKIERRAFDKFMVIPSGKMRLHTFNNLMWFHCGGAWQFIDEAQFVPDTYNIYVSVTNPPVDKCTNSNKKFEKTDLSGSLTSNIISIKVVEKNTEQMLNLARSAAKAFCSKFNFPAEKKSLLNGPPISESVYLKRNGRDVVSYRWLGGGRGDYIVQPEIFVDNGQVIVYGGYSHKEFGPWVYEQGAVNESNGN